MLKEYLVSLPLEILQNIFSHIVIPYPGEEVFRSFLEEIIYEFTPVQDYGAGLDCIVAESLRMSQDLNADTCRILEGDCLSTGTITPTTSTDKVLVLQEVSEHMPLSWYEDINAELSAIAHLVRKVGKTKADQSLNMILVCRTFAKALRFSLQLEQERLHARSEALMVELREARAISIELRQLSQDMGDMGDDTWLWHEIRGENAVQARMMWHRDFVVARYQWLNDILRDVDGLDMELPVDSRDSRKDVSYVLRQPPQPNSQIVSSRDKRMEPSSIVLPQRLNHSPKERDRDSQVDSFTDCAKGRERTRVDRKVAVRDSDQNGRAKRYWMRVDTEMDYGDGDEVPWLRFQRYQVSWHARGSL